MQRQGKLRNDAMTHVETSAVRHAYVEPPHAARGAAFDQRL